jgi:hypothetical protein
LVLNRLKNFFVFIVVHLDVDRKRTLTLKGIDKYFLVVAVVVVVVFLTISKLTFEK